MPIRFDHPAYLWLLLLAVPIVWLGMRSLATLDRTRRWTAIGVRLAVLTVLVMMLAGLQAIQRHTDLTVIAVADQSQSVRQLAGPPPDIDPQTGQDRNAGMPIEQWQKRYLEQAASDRRQQDRWGMVRYDRRPSVVLPSETVQTDPGTVIRSMEGTDTAAAIRAAMASAPADSASRIVLLTDGNDTSGDVLAAAQEAAAAGISIDVLPLSYQLNNEVMVEAVYAPTEAREGQTIPVRVVLRATRPATGTLQLLHDDDAVDLNGSEPGTGAPVSESEWAIEEGAQDADRQAGRYLLVKQVDLPLPPGAGANRFEAVFQPDEGVDAMDANNRGEAFTLAQGEGRVLYVDGVGGPSGRILPEALRSHDINVDHIPPSGLPVRLSELSRYDAVLFQNVSAEQVTGPQQDMLVKYVHDLGGGFAMIGGPDSFGAGAWTNSPIDKYLLPVTCEIPSQTVLPSGALVLVIDRSGSMHSTVMGTNKTQIELASEAAILAVQTLYPQDLVGVVAFDSSAYVVYSLQPNNDANAVASKIRSIQAGGGTSIYPGLEEAYRQLAPLKMQDAAVRHVILLTDGQSAPGNYVKLIGQMAAAGITLSTIGVGDGHDAGLLSQLAQMGGGNYHPVQNPNNLPQVFIKEAKTIRKNLIREETFTPTLQQTGSPVMTGFTTSPPLKGLVLTGEREDPRVFLPLLGPEGEPLFAHWQVGLGRAAAFTSDATNRWADAWLNWGGYSDFWARVVRQIARPTQSRAVDFATTVQNGRLQMRLDAGGIENGGDFLQARASVITPDGSTITDITLEQIGPGLYSADMDAEATGNYIVSLMITDPAQKQRIAAVGGATRPPGEELRRFTSNLPVLQQIASITGGRMLDPTNPQANPLYERTQSFESRSIRPLWPTLLIILLALFLLDVANRRIAWDLGSAWGWTRERVAAIAGANRERSVDQHGTLDALRKTRDRQARPEQPAAEPAAAPATAVASDEPAPDRKRKFEASPDAVARDDFADAVGGAKKTDRSAVPVGAGNNHGDDEEGGMSRLMAAKRAARQRMNQDS